MPDSQPSDTARTDGLVKIDDGCFISLEGGEEDNTIRPTATPEEELKKFREHKFPPKEPAEVFISMAGGIEDNTIRPSTLPRKVLDAIKTGSLSAVRKAWESIHQSNATDNNSKANCSKMENTKPRTADIDRITAETQIQMSLDLDGAGKAELSTGVGFFDHMLTLLAKHSLIDLTLEAKGDLHVDAHHTVEDVGICFGKALTEALGDKAGIRRYGSATVPMDETLVTAAVDLSGRPFLVWQVDLPLEMLGTFSSQLAEEFWRAVSSSGALNLHVICHHGTNTHHIIEAVFKATARALRQALEIDPRMAGIPSTKGVL